MLLSRQMWVSSRYECSLSTNKVTHIQGSGGHCRCHYNSLHVEQLPFFHVFQASMKRSWSARHAPSPSRVTRSPRLAHARLKKRKNNPYSVGYCHKGLPTFETTMKQTKDTTCPLSRKIIDVDLGAATVTQAYKACFLFKTWGDFFSVTNRSRVENHDQLALGTTVHHSCYNYNWYIYCNSSFSHCP